MYTCVCMRVFDIYNFNFKAYWSNFGVNLEFHLTALHTASSEALRPSNREI